jgi:two-component system sensor histidine kinase and response regulator WspE
MSESGFSMMDLFREEVRTHAGSLNQGLLLLESSSADAQTLEPLMRAAHSIKGAARIVGVDLAVKLAHVMEDVFVAAQREEIRLNSSDIDTLLRGTDLLAELATLPGEDPSAWVSKYESAVGELSQQILAILTRPKSEKIEASSQSAPPAPEKLPSSPIEKPIVESAPTPAPATANAPLESVVRVTAQNLTRLMGLAGESLVQARWLQPFTTSLLKLKKHHDHLAAVLDGLEGELRSENREQLGAMVAEARRQATQCSQRLSERIAEFEEHAARAEDLNSRLYLEVIGSRMRPFSDGVQGFPRMVRDLARFLDKQVRLEIVGQTTEVDRDILDKLEAPLTHLLRNAIDHGLESPGERREADKPECGVVRLEARHRAGMLVLTVEDDGRGIDLEKLRKKILDRGLSRADLLASMCETELLSFLFLPGFSTAAEVTEVSGRGVGLDVVQEMVRKVGGSVHITTQVGKGTAFHLQLPLTLSVLRAVVVDIAGETYAFPHNRIDRLVNIPRAGLDSLENRQFVSVDGRNVGLVLAAQVFDLPTHTPPGDDLDVLLVGDAAGQYGLIVNAFRGEQDLVVRPLDSRLGKVPNVSALAILDDGAPVLIADVEDLLRSLDRYIQTGTLSRCETPKSGVVQKKRVLVVDDSITVREVERQILVNRGYDVSVAVDGQEGWNLARAERFDLLISDVDMPRMNGLELVQAVRADPSMRNVPVIIVSYKDRESDRLRGMEVGANYYLTKGSFHDNTFLQAVVDLIGEP